MMMFMFLAELGDWLGRTVPLEAVPSRASIYADPSVDPVWPDLMLDLTDA